MTSRIWLFITAGAGVVSLAASAVVYFWVVSRKTDNPRAEEIASWIADGAASYLGKLYSALTMVGLVFGVAITVIFGLDVGALASGSFRLDIVRGLSTSVTFVLGVLCSAAAGYMGMSIAVKANVRSAVAAVTGLNEAFKVAFYAGSVMGLAMIGVASIGMSLIYIVTGDPGAVVGFSFGASTMALLAKAGGGIYTKTADIAADLVGKVEIGMPEDDPRNPAVIADNVGDNVGDVAGMGADIFDSYVASAVAAMLLGFSVTDRFGDKYVVLPLILCALGIAASLLGIQFVRVGKNGKPGSALNRGTVLTCVIFAVFDVALVLLGGYNIGVLIATLSGLLIGVLMGFTTDYFTSDEHRPVREVARVSGSGSAINIITGFSYGLISVVPTLLGIVAATLVSYYSAEAYGMPGVYGVAIAAVGMLSITGMIVSADAYGPIVDNSKGIAEMSGMPYEIIERCDTLDSAGNTAKAITKGFAISAAALTVLALFSAYSEVIERQGIPFTIDLRNPVVLAGVFLGSMAPPFFSALTMLAVTKNAFSMIEEIRRQFRAFPGILAGTTNPDYNRCVAIAAQGALRALLLPAFIAVGLPLLVGFLLGPHALGGFLGGAIFTGVIFALLMANAGGTWDNAKKLIESGEFGGPGSEAHKAAVVGDTVGDPFKDTAGPSLNTLITVMTLVSSLFAPLIAALALME